MLPCGARVPGYSEAGLETRKGALLGFSSLFFMGLTVRENNLQLMFLFVLGVLFCFFFNSSPTKEELKKSAQNPLSPLNVMIFLLIHGR